MTIKGAKPIANYSEHKSTNHLTNPPLNMLHDVLNPSDATPGCNHGNQAYFISDSDEPEEEEKRDESGGEN